MGAVRGGVVRQVMYNINLLKHRDISVLTLSCQNEMVYMCNLQFLSFLNCYCFMLTGQICGELNTD